MKTGEWVTAETAMTCLGMDQAGFVDLLRKKVIRAYRRDTGARTDFAGVIEDRRCAAKERQGEPRWGNQPEGNFGGGVGREMFKLTHGELPEENAQMESEALNLVKFKPKEIAVCKRKHASSAPIREEKLPAPETQKDQERAPNHFIRCGESWQVGFGGEKNSIKDRENIRYIVHLLENEGRQMHVFDLVRAVKGHIPGDDAERYAKMTDEQMADEGMNRATLNGGRSGRDTADYKKVKQLLADLKKIKQSGIPMEIEEAQREYDEKVAPILKSTGKERGTEEENARTNVRNHMIGRQKGFTPPAYRNSPRISTDR